MRSPALAVALLILQQQDLNGFTASTGLDIAEQMQMHWLDCACGDSCGRSKRTTVNGGVRELQEVGWDNDFFGQGVAEGLGEAEPDRGDR